MDWLSAAVTMISVPDAFIWTPFVCDADPVGFLHLT